MITKGNRIELRDEGVFQGYARALSIVGPNFAGALLDDVGTITWSGRELVTANRTYFVRTDGSNSNTGLVNSAGGAFLTLQKAIDTVAALDLSTFTVTIQLGIAGSYAGFTVTAPFVGGPGSLVSVIGNTGAASTYIITSSVSGSNGASFSIAGVDFTPASGDALSALTASRVAIIGACTFGATAAGARQLLATGSGRITISAVLTMDGGAGNWILTTTYGSVSSNGNVHVFSGTPAYTTTVVAQTASTINVVNGTPSGAATGTRYSATLNSVIFTNGGGANFFPGDVAGATATGGQYA